MTHTLALERRDVLVCSCAAVFADLPEAVLHLRDATDVDDVVPRPREAAATFHHEGKRPRCPVCHRSFRGKQGLAVHQTRAKHAAGGNPEPATVG